MKYGCPHLKLCALDYFSLCPLLIPIIILIVTFFLISILYFILRHRIRTFFAVNSKLLPMSCIYPSKFYRKFVRKKLRIYDQTLEKESKIINLFTALDNYHDPILYPHLLCHHTLLFSVLDLHDAFPLAVASISPFLHNSTDD